MPRFCNARWMLNLYSIIDIIKPNQSRYWQLPWTKLMMAPDDTPGSPRKRVKLEEHSSMNKFVHSSSTGHEMGTVDGAFVTVTGTSPKKAEVQHNSSEVSNAENSDKPYISTERVNMATFPPDPELDQLNKEKGCGIIELVSPDLLGFSGILKKRYTDFMVHEILPSGKVLHLSNLKASKSGQEKEDVEQAKRSLGNAASLQNTTVAPTEAAEKAEEGSEIHNEGSATNPSPHVRIDKNESGSNQEAEMLLPHQRAILLQPTIECKSSGSFQPPPKLSPGKLARKREKFYIRYGENGWTEVDREKGNGEKQMGAMESVSNNPNPNDESKSNISTKENIHSKTMATNDAVANQPRTTQTFQPSSPSQWQAYANLDGDSDALDDADTLVSSTQVDSDPAKISEEDNTTLLSYFPESVMDAIRSLHTRILKSPYRSTSDYGTVKSGVIDRHLRTKIHQDIRRIFQSRLETTTDKDGAIIFTAMRSTGIRQNSGISHPNVKHGPGSGRHDSKSSIAVSRGYSKPKWEELGGEHLHFTLYKENKDTIECTSWLSKILKLGPKSFAFAGTKDRRAVTVQRISVYRQTVSRMIDAGKTLRQANIGDYEYCPHALQLGDLTGNEFTITLRDCTFDNSNIAVNTAEQAQLIVSEALKCLIDRGFINYYGLQRFGTFSNSTSDIGVKLLQGEFKAAVEAILHYTPHSLATYQNNLPEGDRASRDDKARSHAIHTFQTTGNTQKALAGLPRKFSAESSVIRHLGSRSNQKRDYLGAILSIQRNLRLMYVHAYQSLVWNMAASKRWSTYGDSVVTGDLVLIKEHSDKEEAPSRNEEIDEDGEPIIQPAAEDRATNVEDIFTRARILSKEEAESGKYTIFDIVLPSPGFDILYPENEVGQFYKDFMASPAGGGFDLYDMRRPQRDFSLSGSYRKLLAKPGKDASFEIKTYERDDEQFVETDLDLLQKAQDASDSHHEDNSHKARAGDTEDISKEHAGEKRVEPLKDVHLTQDIIGEAKPESEDEEDARGGVTLEKAQKKIAVILKLQLGSSQYATMALRELMKAGGVKTYKPEFAGGR